MAYFDTYLDQRGEHRWRLLANNGKIVAVSGEGYTSRQGAADGIAFVKLNAPQAPIK